MYCIVFPDSSVGKESSCNAGDPSSTPGLGRSNGEGIGYPLQYSGLENTMDYIVHGVAKSWTWMSDFYMDLTFQISMQCCSLQHWTLLPSPVTSTTGYCFYFGSVSSFFLELFLYSSPVAYWAPTDLGSSSFSVLSFCLFILFMGFSRQEYWSGLPFPSPVDQSSHIPQNSCGSPATLSPRGWAPGLGDFCIPSGPDTVTHTGGGSDQWM